MAEARFKAFTIGAMLAQAVVMGPQALSAGEANFAVPSGSYVMDPNHATLSFKVGHLGLSTYVARFTTYTSKITFNAENPTASHVEIKLDPHSIRADYAGDYRATYPYTPTETWDEHLAQDANFFNANRFPEITFASTAVEQTGARTGIVQGELTMLGQTHPLDMKVTFVGAVPDHPFIKGMAAIGFSARGVIKRSDYGMTFLLEPPFVDDEVSIEFEAEYLMPNPSQ